MFSPNGINWNALNAKTFLDAFGAEDPPRPERTTYVDCVIDIEAIYEKHGSIVVSHVTSFSTKQKKPGPTWESGGSRIVLLEGGYRIITKSSDVV